MVGITPTGFISFLPSCYGGQTSDKFITRDSGFYDLLLERVDEVIQAWIFKFKKFCYFFFCRLVVPLRARKKNQKIKSKVKKTKDDAHVERAVN